MCLCPFLERPDLKGTPLVGGTPSSRVLSWEGHDFTVVVRVMYVYKVCGKMHDTEYTLTAVLRAPLCPDLSAPLFIPGLEALLLPPELCDTASSWVLREGSGGGASAVWPLEQGCSS